MTALLWRRHVARAATRAHIRGPGWSGFGAFACDHLAEMDLKGIRADRGLGPQLDEQTDAMVQEWEEIAGPTGADAWGIARKSINEFLLDASHHQGVRPQFGEDVDRLCAMLEVPMDRKLADQLMAEVRPGAAWPRGESVTFPGLRRMDGRLHAAWQWLAGAAARSTGLTRPELWLHLVEGGTVAIERREDDEMEQALEAIRAAS